MDEGRVLTTAPRRWTLDHQAFEILLSFLASDRNTAGEKYERLRRKLYLFFKYQGALDPDDLVDESFDRVARRLAGGEKIRASEPGRYFLGVARKLIKEDYKSPERNRSYRENPERAAQRAAAGEDVDKECRGACLDRCLARVPEEQRQLLIEYYSSERGEKIAHHRRLAGRLGIRMPALRTRMHRLRAKLRVCVDECLKRRPTS